MVKKYSTKFWIVFWLVSFIFLAAFYYFLNYRGNIAGDVANILPVSEKYKSVASFVEYFSAKDDREKTFLVLFQNNLEIRPGGGFVGSFGILKIKNGGISDLQIHDTGIFDGRVPDGIMPPYPIPETLRITSWKLRDSNFSPDFATNAKKAEEFYYLGKGGEKFDGVIGITTNVLISFLKATGPIAIEGYPGTYADESAIYDLEYQVEKAFEEQGIARADRKSVLNDLGKAILQKVTAFDMGQKIKLAEIIYDDLNKKDIQLFFTDSALNAQAQKAGWAGEIDQDWKSDFLMTSDANFGAWKSDYYVKRSLDYTIDLTKDVPEAKLLVTYNHTAVKRDFMTKDYLTFLRVYAPEGSWLVNNKNFSSTKFGTELGKKYFGAIIYVPLGASKTVELNYTLPKQIGENYNLKIQKQPGLNDIPVVVHVIDKTGQKKDYQFTMNSDIVLNK
ncbi:MAG: DUF4012 domain-containing protein [Parcubacteria group bacterium]